jgi:hypothetical protein
MVKNWQQTKSAAYARQNTGDKMLGLGCIIASASVSFGMLTWMIQLLINKGLPF